MPPGAVIRLCPCAKRLRFQEPTLVATATRPMLSDAGVGFGDREARLVGGNWRRLGDGQEDRAYKPPRSIRDTLNVRLYTTCKAG